MRSGALFLGIFGVFWTLLVGAFDGFVGYNLVRQVVSLGYLSAKGRVLGSEVTRHRGSKGGSTYGVKIEYLYVVGDQEFRGERFRYSEGSSSDSAWAHNAVKEHPVGSETVVFYNPKQPADALLSPGVDGSDLLLLLFLTPFNAVMLGFWAAAGSVLWFKLRRPPAGGVPIRVTQRQTRVRLAEFGPLATALATAGLSAFVAIFVVAFGLGGFHPKLHVILTVWSVVLGITFVATTLQWWRVHSGHHDLVLNDMESSLELPPSSGRGEFGGIPYSAVQEVWVETVVQRGSRGSTSQTFAPKLRLRPGYGANPSLGKFHDQRRAEAFAEWLREKLRLPAQPGPGTNGSHPTSR